MENPIIRIVKIEMSWFMAINGKKSVEFKETNLIDGSQNEIKQSIAKAIDVILCSEYEDSTASLICLNETIDPRNKRQSYVQMHLSGSSEFVINGEESRQFYITRYFNKTDVNSVFTKVVDERRRQHKQSIQKFHIDLDNVGMLRTMDPFISPDCTPNGSDINQFIVKMINLKECVTTANKLRNNYLVDSMKAAEITEISKMFNEKWDGIKDSMTEIRTLKCALITQQMEEIKQNYPDVSELGKHRRLLSIDIKQKKLNKKLNILQSILDHHCKEFNAKILAERKAIKEFEQAIDQERIHRINEGMEEFRNVFCTYVDQMTATREYNLKVYEHVITGIEWNRVNDMQDPAVIAIETKKHDEQLKKVVQFVAKLNVDADFKRLKNQMTKGLQAICDNVVAIKNIDDDFIRPAQKLFLFKRQKLQNYKQIVNHENNLVHARAEMEKFYASDNWLSELQIEVLQKGHQLLSVYSNEFHERFLGHIGQFIDVNTDFDILRVALPILSKDYLSAFIFSRKDIADDFVKTFKAAYPGKTILAFGKDEWQTDLEADAPDGVSLDEKILSAETLQRYPFIKNFYRTFCITAGNNNDEYCKNIAINGICKIFNGNIYYDQTSSTLIRGANNNDYLKSVVEKWSEMGKKLHDQLDLGYKKSIVDKNMKASEKQIITFESELNKSRLRIRILKEKIKTILATHFKTLSEGEESLKFKGEWHVKAKVLRMKREWLHNRSALHNQKPQIFTDARPDIINPKKAELALIVAIEKFANFHAKGFPLIVYQSEDFKKLKDWVSNCEDIAPLNLQIESQPNVVSDDDIVRRMKQNNELDAVYKKLLCLCNEKDLLSENVDFCQLGVVAQLAQSDRAELRRRLDQAQQNLPPNVILPGSDLKFITPHLNLFDNDTKEKMRVVLALTTRKCEEASWDLKLMARKYFQIIVDFLKNLNESYDWNDHVLIFRLNTANDAKITFIDHENEQMNEWIRSFTAQELCADDTQLNFYLKSEETGDYIINDQLYIKQQTLATLLHTWISRLLNPLIFILNNTIVGRSANDVADIIQKNRRYQRDELDAQVFLFSRSNVDYRNVFRHYRRIECQSANNNRWKIITTDHAQ